MNKLSGVVLFTMVAVFGIVLGCTTSTPTPTTAPAAPTATVAPTAVGGEPSGKDLFASKFCASCHGANGEGGFGPPLAGTERTAAQAVTKVRGAFGGRMPSFSEKQVSDGEIGRIVDYVRSLPKPATIGTYKFSAKADDPAGQVVFINKGCANCHGIPPNVAGTKLTAQEEISQVRTPRSRMGAFTPAQISDADVTSVNEWLRGLPAPTPRPG